MCMNFEKELLFVVLWLMMSMFLFDIRWKWFKVMGCWLLVKCSLLDGFVMLMMLVMLLLECGSVVLVVVRVLLVVFFVFLMDVGVV